jgi:hypothetical protein
VNIYEQDPNAVVLYVVDWEDALTGDTITGTPTWVNPDAVTTSGATNTTTLHRIKVSAPAVGTRYRLTSRIVTTAGFTYDYTFMVIGKER